MVKSQLWLGLNIEPMIIPTTSARKEVLGRGGISKEKVFLTLTNQGLPVSNNNESDAFLIAKTLYLRVKKSKK